MLLGVGALAVLSSVLILGLIVWQASRERAERIEREKDALARMAQVVASETEDMLSRINLFFATADIWLSANPGAEARKDPTFALLVDSFRASGKGRIDIRLVSESGGLFFIPSASSVPLADVSDRDYFTMKDSAAERGFFVGEPIKGRVTHIWTIPVSHALSTHNAGISIIWAAIEMPVLEELYDAVRPKPNGSVSLIRNDGVLLARAPFDASIIGASITANTPAWIKMIQDEPTGIWVLRTVRTDNKERILAYYSLPAYGLVVSVSSRLDDVLAVWMSGLWWRALIAVIMLVAVGTISARLLTALSRLEAAQGDLRDNLERLRKSDATKDKLFSLIAHDLRGPIGGMSNLLETLATDRGDMRSETLDEFIAALRLTSWNTYQLLENLLSWSRSERGEMPFHPERMLLLPLVEDSKQVFATSIVDKGLRIDVDVALGLEIRVDPELAKVIFRNLISNAIKFTRKGGTIHIEARPAQGGSLVVVRDEGIGMDEAELGTLFDFRSTKTRSGTENERGSGLGLVLCKEIMGMHGGRIEVTSEIEKGSSFSAFFPD